MNEMSRGRTEADIEAVLRDLDAEDLELLEPPDDIWAGIESTVRGESAAGGDGQPSDTSEASGAVVSLDSRRRSVGRIVLGAAAALVLIAAGLTALLLTRDNAGQVVATASLAYDPDNFDALGAQARAGANLVADRGSHSVVIVDAALPAPEAGTDLEVWLIRPDAEGNVADLVSLGVVDPADPGSLEVPSGYDPGTYFVVDISVEPRDGNAGHSGRSILRGPLQDA